MYSAKVLADSIALGVRLTTLEVTFPRFILAEFNTHRMLSRNSASSRAIPVERRIEQVLANPFVPEAFGLNKSGMQASADIGGWRATLARWIWTACARVACIFAWMMSKLGVHKQHANRLLEPWCWHTVVVTATEWANFYALRDHKAAQPEMQITARRMKEAMAKSTPRPLSAGQWHLPYVDENDFFIDKADDLDTERGNDMIKVSVVKCAAVSFERQSAERTRLQVRDRHDTMVRMAHWSPFEHQARVSPGDPELSRDFIGNFRFPWVQYRKTFSGEAVFDGR